MIIADRKTHEIIYAEPFTAEQTEVYYTRLIERAAPELLAKLYGEAANDAEQ